MKQLYALFAVLGIFSATTFASQLPMIRPMEKVLVKEVRQFANLMPVIGPGPRPVVTDFTIEVDSHGCTREDNFKVKVSQLGQLQMVEFVRVIPDPCDGMKRRIELQFTTRALHLSRNKPIHIENPLLVDEKIVY